MNAAAAAEPIVTQGRVRRRRPGCIFPTIVPRRGDHPRDDGRRARQPHLRARGRLSRRARPGARGAQQRRHRHRAGEARWPQAGTLQPHDVRVPGHLVDAIVVAPDQLQTTQTPYDPAISRRDHPAAGRASAAPSSGVEKVDRPARGAWSCRTAMAVNLGFGISADVPRILLEEGLHGAVTWVIEQGAVGGVPLLGFAFGCASNAEAIMPSPQQFTYFQGGGFDCLSCRSSRSTARATSTSRKLGKPSRT